MQNYKEINGNDYVKESRTTINETMRSIQSMNSGTAFPTANLFEGMKCYRTDLKKTYTLTDVENNTWVEDDTASKLSTAHKINITGDASGSANFDGSSDVSINVNVNSAAYLKKTGDTATGAIIAPSFQTGTAEANYFQCKKFRGEGNADNYYHAIDVGYDGHDRVDFYEYGGTWNFYKNTSSDRKTSSAILVGSIKQNGWNGNVVGNVTGNADTATHADKATADANGNNIVATYETKSDSNTKFNETTSYTNRLQRNKEYKVGDIAYSPNLPSWAYLECITAGTTGTTEPDFSSVSGTSDSTTSTTSN